MRPTPTSMTPTKRTMVDMVDIKKGPGAMQRTRSAGLTRASRPTARQMLGLGTTARAAGVVTSSLIRAPVSRDSPGMLAPTMAAAAAGATLALAAVNTIPA